LPKKEFRSPRRMGEDLREKLRGVEPHSRGSKILSRGGRKRNSREDMQMPTHFLVPEAEEEAEEELSRVSRVVKTAINQWIVQRGKWTEEKLTLLRHRGVTRMAKMLTVGGHWACIKSF